MQCIFCLCLSFIVVFFHLFQQSLYNSAILMQEGGDPRERDIALERYNFSLFKKKKKIATELASVLILASVVSN